MSGPPAPLRVAFATVLLLALAACGGDDTASPDDSPASSVTEEESGPTEGPSEEESPDAADSESEESETEESEESESESGGLDDATLPETTLSAAEPGEVELLPATTPEAVPIPVGAVIEPRDESPSYIGFNVIVRTTDSEDLLSFFVSEFDARGFTLVDSGFQPSQFGNSIEGRKYEMGDLNVDIAVWFPLEGEGQAFSNIDIVPASS